MFKFKDVVVTFDMKVMEKYDQEYLKTMAYETVQSNSFLHSGKSFDQMYPDASNFTMFDDYYSMISFMSEYSNPWASHSSHLLDGKKYWLAWTYTGV
jgi:hypothetical protein